MTPIQPQPIAKELVKVRRGQGEPATTPTIRASGALTAARSFGVFILCFAVFMSPWPGLNQAYGRFFWGMAAAVLSTVGTYGRCDYIPIVPDKSTNDIKLRLSNMRVGVWRSNLGFSSRYLGYVPTALVAALVLASPIGWRRRGWAMLWGMLAVNLFALLRLLAALLFEFAGLSGDQDLRLFTPGPVTTLAIAFAHLVLITSPAGGFVIPVVIWAVTTFRRRDWNQLLSRTIPVEQGRLLTVPDRGR